MQLRCAVAAPAKHSPCSVRPEHTPSAAASSGGTVQVLARCDGPFSEEFAQTMLALMAACAVHRKREVGRLAEARARLLHGFARHVSAMPFAQGMSPAERELLANLAQAS